MSNRFQLKGFQVVDLLRFTLIQSSLLLIEEYILEQHVLFRDELISQLNLELIHALEF
jgi:hypothetical protein